MGEDLNREDYFEYVKDTLKKFESFAKFSKNNSELKPSEVNTALVNYGKIFAFLVGEYEFAKEEEFEIEKEFQNWYDEKFILIKEEMLKKIGSSSTKPAIKEYEIELRFKYKEEYNNWIHKKTLAHYKMRYVNRLLNQLYKYDNILTTLSYNMRSEMKNLSLEDRMNFDPNRNRVRSIEPRYNSIKREAIN